MRGMRTFISSRQEANILCKERQNPYNICTSAADIFLHAHRCRNESLQSAKIMPHSHLDEDQKVFATRILIQFGLTDTIKNI